MDEGQKLTLLNTVVRKGRMGPTLPFLTTVLRGHPERTSQVRGEGGSAQGGHSKAIFIVTMMS